MKPLDHRSLRGSEVGAAGFDDLQRILDSIPQMVWASLPGPREYYNPQWIAFTGAVLKPDGSTRRELIHPDDRERAVAVWERCRSTGEPYELEYRLRHRSGEYRWILSRGRPERNRAGDIVWYGTCTDVHERVLAGQALAASEALTRNIIQASADALKLVDAEGTILFLNDAALCEAGSEGATELVGRNWLDLLSPSSRGLGRAAMATALAGGVARFTTIDAGASGGTRWRNFVVTPVVEAGRVLSLVVNSRDVSEEREAEQRLRWTANHDSLTRLPNRGYFNECLREALRQSRRDGRRLGLLIVDVDDLKQINDAMGHAAGDSLLCAFAERLAAGCGGQDVIGRLGGDEFGILMTDVAGAEIVEERAQALFAALRAPLTLDGRLIDCRGSIGASLYPQHGADEATLLKHADLALYAAKSNAGAACLMFQPAMRAEMQTRSSMLALAADAVREERIVPYYQPKIDLRTGRVVGLEALMRWRDRKGAVQLPGTIGIALDDNEIGPAITGLVMARIVADARRWLASGVPFGHVALNTSAADFRTQDFAERLLGAIAEAGLPPSAVQLEVTETVFLGRGAECVETALRRLSAAGIKIALDDFGTGFASLSHLKKFPVDVLKIDRSFVRDLDVDPDDAAIVRGVVNLAAALGITAVAEGVETLAQERFLRSQGCDQAQGFLFAKPMPSADVAAFLADPRRAAACA